MTTQRLGEVFKLLGKFISLSDYGTACASGVKTRLIATQQQFGTAAPNNSLYDDLSLSLIPLQQRMQPVASMLDRVPAIVQASAEGYLHALADELNQAASATVAGSLSALAGQVAAASGSISPSGQYWNYFRDTWSFEGFPASATPAYPDAWITTVVVE
jgi:hypothetical protein